ncbi:MAG: glycosyltransferase family 9 protein [Flavobacteriales bacterium]|nr:glycosyltransferase family 9 protein [Flavobacteriales bacterium]
MNLRVKILIIRFSSIGDIVLTTPVIRCLKNQLEGELEIHYLTKKIYSPLLENNPFLHKVHSIEKSTNEVIEDLIQEDFDYIVDLHKNLRSSRVKQKLEGLSFSFEKLNWQKWLLVNLKINRMPKLHIVDRYLDSVKALGVKNDGKGLDYFLPDGIEKNIQLPSFTDEGYVALVLGATHATKRLPPHRIKELTSKIDSPIVLIGGKEDQSIGQEIERTAPSRIYNASGKTNLNESATLIKNAKVVITHDTGMMHIAAAFQKKIISIWGNTVPDFGMYPYLNKQNKSNYTVAEVNNLSCRPCSKIGFDKCPKGHFKCMEKIQLDKIVEAI